MLNQLKCFTNCDFAIKPPDGCGLLLDNKYGCLPVVESMRLTGILTEADFVRYLADAA